MQWGHAVAQLVETLRYKPHYGHGVDSASNRNEYPQYFLEDKGGRCVWLITLPPSCVDCLEIWEPQPPGTLWACNRPVQELLRLFYIYAVVNNEK